MKGVSFLNNYTYKCRKTQGNIDIDGKLHKACWNEADEIQLVDNSSGVQALQNTTVKALWNDDFLYVAFSCKDDLLNAYRTQYNDALYQEDVVEVFIDDNNDLKSYVEIEVNPLNALLHYFIYNDLNGKIFSYGRNEKTITTAVAVEGTNWSVELAIPMKEFATAPHLPPKQGDIWKANFYRIDKKANDTREYTAWSPTGKVNYHIPLKFGDIVFVE